MQLILDVSELLLERNFSTTIHDDICAAIGLERGALVSGKPLQRDPDFRPRVLSVYSFRCAVCGFDMRLGQHAVGLEAAHIKWHQAGGPNTVDNGLSLCVMHHKLLDLGAFALSDERQILVSDQAYGYGSTDDWMIRFHGSFLAPPQNPNDLPRSGFLDWHRREVFKGAPRFLESKGV